MLAMLAPLVSCAETPTVIAPPAAARFAALKRPFWPAGGAGAVTVTWGAGAPIVTVAWKFSWSGDGGG
jgi:hypothetical protein